MTSILDLPPDLIEVIIRQKFNNVLDKVSKSKDIKKIKSYAQLLACLSSSCKYVNNLMNNWETIFIMKFQDNINLNRDCGMALAEINNGLQPSRALSLIVDTGCELCKAPRIRKVTWEFHNRYCEHCLKNVTVSDYCLKKLYNVDETLLTGLPFTTVDLYKRGIGYYSLNFYLKSSVILKISKLMNTSFESLDDVRKFILINKQLDEEVKREREEAIYNVIIHHSNKTMNYYTFFNNLTLQNMISKSNTLHRIIQNNIELSTEDINSIIREIVEKSVKIKVTQWTREIIDENKKSVTPNQFQTLVINMIDLTMKLIHEVEIDNFYKVWFRKNVLPSFDFK